MEIAASVIVIVLRLVVPISIFRWPLAGFLASIAADALDVVILDFFGWGIFGDYTFSDKILDTYFITIGFIVSLGWINKLAKNTAIFLYAIRLIGYLLFLMTQERLLFFVFPNLFEFYFVFYLLFKKFFDEKINNYWKVAILLLVLYIPKFAQEYVLHFLEIPTWDVIKNILQIG